MKRYWCCDVCFFDGELKFRTVRAPNIFRQFLWELLGAKFERWILVNEQEEKPCP